MVEEERGDTEEVGGDLEVEVMDKEKVEEDLEAEEEIITGLDPNIPKDRGESRDIIGILMEHIQKQGLTAEATGMGSIQSIEEKGEDTAEEDRVTDPREASLILEDTNLIAIISFQQKIRSHLSLIL